MKKVITILGSLFLGATLYNATASMVAIGDPFPHNSWAQRFNEEGVGFFDRLEVFSVSGSSFEAPSFRNFGSDPLASTWSGSGGGSASVANGTQVSNLQFDLIFNDPQMNPTVFDFYAWRGNTRLEATRATWNGGWSFAPTPSTELHATPVPEPSTMIAGALLLLPFGASAVRILRKNRAA